MSPSTTQFDRKHVDSPLMKNLGHSSDELDPYLELNVNDENNWKIYRTAKYQRDLLKRMNCNGVKVDSRDSSLDNVFKSKMVEVPPTSGMIGSFSHQRSVREIHGDSRPCTIPRRRKEKCSWTSPLMSSHSMPSVKSWPPPKDDTHEGCDNWASLPMDIVLPSSAPEESGFCSYNKGGARTMTIFEKALIYDSAGNILTHGHFDGHNSPEFSPQIGGRKSKRRVGRHRFDKKKVDQTSDRMTVDVVVVEMMHVLLPNADVTSDLNRHFLGGSHVHDGMFKLDEDWQDTSQLDQYSTTNYDKLSISTVKFQSVLTNLLFPKDEPEIPSFPRTGTCHFQLVERYITSPWIAKSILNIVRLDITAQYENFAVILSVFRTTPERRIDIMKAIVSTCMAIFEHQNLKRVNARADNLKCVSVKGVISLISGILTTVEEEDNVDSLGNPVGMIDESPVGLYDLVMECMKFLVRTSPANVSKSDDKILDKYKQDSESVEATTYSAIGQVIYHLATLSQNHGKEMLNWMLRKWPQRNVQLQLFFLRYIAGIVSHFMKQCIFLTSELVDRVFGRICTCVQSPHFMIAKEAACICGNLPLMDMYLSRDQSLREKLSSALHGNATKHWNDRVRQISDEYFDLLLDFAV